MYLLVLLLCSSFAASQAPINPAQFPKTTELRSDLSGVVMESNSLNTCISKVTSPLGKVIEFSDDVQDIEDDMKKIEGRIEVIVAVMQAIMMIPYVGQVAAFVLEPAIAVLNVIKNGLSHVEPTVRKFAGLIHKWTEPLKEIQKKIDWVEGKIGQFTSVVSQVEAKTAAAEGCVNSLPHGSIRNTGIHALEGVSGKLDVVPDGFKHAVSAVNGGCSKVENVLHKIHLVRKRRGLPVLSTIKHVLDAIVHSFGPVGDFLDKVDHVLHKKFCLLHSLKELGKIVIKVGEKVVHAAEHFIDEAGHVWVEIEAKAEHVLHNVVHGIEHVGTDIAHGAVHIANEIVSGSEHVVHQIENGAETVVHGVVHGAKEVAHVAENVGKTVVHGVETVGKDIAKGAEEVGHVATSVVHKIGHFFGHIFGRRDVHELYRIDGKVYVLVDGQMHTRNRRGIDVCISLSDVLKGVNLVTGGLMKKAQDLIGKLFHGHIPFKIPGLTSDVLNIGHLFHGLNFADLLPSAKDILKLPQLDMEKILKLNVKLFEQMMPQCHEAFSKLKFGY